MKQGDSELIVDYFLNAKPDYIKAMGAFPGKMPDRKSWINKLNSGIDKPYGEKEFYFIIWLQDKKPVGHSNLNEIQFGKEARMHLHIWHNEVRRMGMGAQFLTMTIPFYFENLKLQKIICEPYAYNPAPVKTLKSVGFKFIREYETTPGWINFHQKVKRYELENNIGSKLFET